MTSEIEVEVIEEFPICEVKKGESIKIDGDIIRIIPDRRGKSYTLNTIRVMENKPKEVVVSIIGDPLKWSDDD